VQSSPSWSVIINGKPTISDRKQRVVLVKEKITSIYFESKQRYGSPRMKVELASLGSKVSRITVAKYMNQLGLRSKLKKNSRLRPILSIII
jgi:hypothetical protein